MKIFKYKLIAVFLISIMFCNNCSLYAFDWQFNKPRNSYNIFDKKHLEIAVKKICENKYLILSGVTVFTIFGVVFAVLKKLNKDENNGQNGSDSQVVKVNTDVKESGENATVVDNKVEKKDEKVESKNTEPEVEEKPKVLIEDPKKNEELKIEKEEEKIEIVVKEEPTLDENKEADKEEKNKIEKFNSLKDNSLEALKLLKDREQKNFSTQSSNKSEESKKNQELEELNDIKEEVSSKLENISNESLVKKETKNFEAEDVFGSEEEKDAFKKKLIAEGNFEQSPANTLKRPEKMEQVVDVQEELDSSDDESESDDEPEEELNNNIVAEKKIEEPEKVQKLEKREISYHIQNSDNEKMYYLIDLNKKTELGKGFWKLKADWLAIIEDKESMSKQDIFDKLNEEEEIHIRGIDKSFEEYKKKKDLIENKKKLDEDKRNKKKLNNKKSDEDPLGKDRKKYFEELKKKGEEEFAKKMAEQNNNKK